MSTSALDRSAGSRRSSSISAARRSAWPPSAVDGVAQLGHPVVAGRGAGGVDHPSILPQQHGMPPHLGQPSAKRRQRAVQVDAGDVGQRGDPGQDVRELVALLVDRALAQRLGQLPDLLGQPGDRSRQAPLPVARAVRALHQVLQLGQVHGRRVGADRSGRSGPRRQRPKGTMRWTQSSTWSSQPTRSSVDITDVGGSEMRVSAATRRSKSTVTGDGRAFRPVPGR